jgi:multiple sugar transport system substrate-binding protein
MVKVVRLDPCDYYINRSFITLRYHITKLSNAPVSCDKLIQSSPKIIFWAVGEFQCRVSHMPGYPKKFILITLVSLALLVSAGCSQIDPSMFVSTIGATGIHLSASTETITADATRRTLGTRRPTATKTMATETKGEQTVSTTPVAAVTPTSERAQITPSATPMPTQTVAVNRLTGLTIQFWHPWSGETGQMIQQLVEEYNLTNELGIQVETVNPGSAENLNGQMQEALKIDQVPDLVAAYAFQAQEWDATHPLVDFSPYLNDPTWGLKPEEQADFYPVFWESGKLGEKRQAIPALGSGQLLYYNQTWAEQLGFTDPPATLEQFELQACAAALANKQDDSKDKDGSGGLILSTGYSPMLGWLQAFGAKFYDPAKTTGKSSPYNFASPQAAKAFTFLRSLYDKGCAWLPDEPYPEQDFASRRGLFAVNSVTNLPYQAEVMQREGNADHWTVLPFPSPDGQPVIDAYGPALEVFSSTPERQLAAWLFARWLLSPQNQARLAGAAHAYPVRKEALALMNDSQASQPQWARAQQLLKYALAEPTARSWKTVRWALSDAATQLFRSYFTIDKVPELVKLLNQTAADLHSNPP